jgi:hypothetical protein
VVAPRVVLTAGHCVTGGADGFLITAPFAGGQQAIAVQVASPYQSTGESVNPRSVDLAVIQLDRDLHLDSYPTIRKTQLPDDSQVVDLGRIRRGQPTNTFFVSPPIRVRDASRFGFPFDYIASEVIESGDSGGPVIAAGTHEIVAVNSGAGGGTEVLARTDVAADWLDQQIAAAGSVGNGGTDPGNAGSNSDATADPPANDCNTCINASIGQGGACTSPVRACQADQSCLDLNECLGGCQGGDQACIDACAQQSSGGIPEYNALVSCVLDACPVCQ